MVGNFYWLGTNQQIHTLLVRHPNSSSFNLCWNPIFFIWKFCYLSLTRPSIMVTIYVISSMIAQIYANSVTNLHISFIPSHFSPGSQYGPIPWIPYRWNISSALPLKFMASTWHKPKQSPWRITQISVSAWDACNTKYTEATRIHTKIFLFWTQLNTRWYRY